MSALDGKTLHAVIEGSSAALLAIRANALRSALTALGIIIGVAAVIAVVAVMQGLSSTITTQLDDLASDMVIVSAETAPEEAMIGLRNRLLFDDFVAVRERVKGIQDITAMMQPLNFGGRVSQGRHSTTAQILGTNANYQQVVRVYTDQGRFLSESDDLRRRLPLRRARGNRSVAAAGRRGRRKRRAGHGDRRQLPHRQLHLRPVPSAAYQ